MLTKIKTGWKELPVWLRYIGVYASGAYTAILIRHPSIELVISGIIWLLFIAVVAAFNASFNKQLENDKFYENNGHHKGVITFIDEKKDRK